MGGSHVCSNDFFKAQALLSREDEEMKEKQKLKKESQQKAELQRRKGMAIMYRDILILIQELDVKGG